MICNASYDSFEAIPEAFRTEFEQVNGKWQLKESAIPGVGPLFNAGLAANEARAVGQVKTRNEKIREHEETIHKLQDKLSVLDSPGNRVLSKADADTFDSYAALGTPTEIKTKLEKLPELEGKVQKFETTESLLQVTKANGLGATKLNPEVLTDWLSSADNKGLTAFVKTEERTDSKGAKVNVEVPYLRIETAGTDGKTTVSEKELLTFAKEKMPEWKYNALIAGVADAAPVKGNPAPVNNGGGGVSLPNLGSARQEPSADGDKKRPVDKYNEARAAKPNPFAKPAGVLGSVPIPQVR
jgi:hypothetical protein